MPLAVVMIVDIRGSLLPFHSRVLDVTDRLPLFGIHAQHRVRPASRTDPAAERDSENRRSWPEVEPPEIFLLLVQRAAPIFCPPALRPFDTKSSNGSGIALKFWTISTFCTSFVGQGPDERHTPLVQLAR